MEILIDISEITTNRRVTIPKQVMKRLNIDGKARLRWMEENGKVVVHGEEALE